MPSSKQKETEDIESYFDKVKDVRSSKISSGQEKVTEKEKKLAAEKKESAAESQKLATKEQVLKEAKNLVNIVKNSKDATVQQYIKQISDGINEGNMVKVQSNYEELMKYLTATYEKYSKEGNIEKAKEYHDLIETLNKFEKLIPLLMKYYLLDKPENKLIINENTLDKVYPTFKRFLDSVNATQILESEKIKQIEYVRDICIHAALNISSGNGKLTDEQINEIKNSHLQNVYHNSVNNIYILSRS